jgi:hypothetical protein
MYTYIYIYTNVKDENGNKCISEERTSEYIFLDKGRDTTIRSLETRAAGKRCIYT